MAVVVPITVTIGNIRHFSPEKNQSELVFGTLSEIELHGNGRSGNHVHGRLRAQHPGVGPSIAFVVI